MIVRTSDELNYVVANGVQSPGRATLTGVSAPHNYQVQEGYALAGASTIYRGRGIAKPILTLLLWEDAHFAQWPIFKKAIENPTPTKPFFVEMQHPLLASAGIKAVGVEDLGEPVRSPQGGGWTVTIKLIEWRPFKPMLVKPDKSIPAAEKGKPIPPKTEMQKYVLEQKARVEAAITAGRTR
jgi:hypothetical protein